MKRFLMVFAKEPVLGKVKTRLAKNLGDEASLKLYKAFIKDTFQLCRKIKNVNRVLAYESLGRHPEFLKSQSRGFTLYRQEGKTLGHRLSLAFQYAKERKADKTVIIGSDSPHLPSSFLREAFKKLDPHDLILGPSQDGGYYLIGLKKDCGRIFDDMEWSSRYVLQKTLNQARKARLSVHLLKPWQDVDDLGSLQLLKKSLRKNKRVAPFTRRLLNV